jgi:hypothetical protein
MQLEKNELTHNQHIDAVCKKKRRNRAQSSNLLNAMQPWRDFGGPSLGGVFLARSLA